MEDPILLLQTGDVMSPEKIACRFSSYRIIQCSYEDIHKVDREKTRFLTVPVGSVEFVRKYCEHQGLSLPCEMSYPEDAFPFLKRKLRETTFKESSDNEFVKPRETTKAFTGGVKRNLEEVVADDTLVWASETVPFESEFRFYIHDFVTGPRILGWARYDDLSVRNPEPDLSIVEQIAEDMHRNIGPNAYSIDIGWRPDLEQYCLVEVNDAWSLGYYENSDPQSNPPTRQEYADMLVSRWQQILFCNAVDETFLSGKMN